VKARLFSALSMFILAASAFAGEATLTAIEPSAGAPRTVHEAVQRLRAAGVRVTTRQTRSARSLGRVRPNVIEVETGDVAFIIPAAGNLQGNLGTYFRSDVSFGNFINSTQKIGVGWLVQGQDNSNAPLQYFTIPALTIAAMNDFVGTTLNKSGLGALLILAVDSTGNNVDLNAFIDGFSRIWTPQPGSATGTVSQSFPAVSLQDSIDDFTAFALGLRQGGNFRTNVGVVNLDTAAHTWTITSVNTSKTVTLTVPAYSLSQTGISNDFADANGNVALMFDVSATGFSWSAYASSVDNTTGDGWVSRATQ
jgi:hypothetical protein